MAQLRAARRRQPRAGRTHVLRLVVLSAVTVAALVALAPVLLRLYAPPAAGSARAALVAASPVATTPAPARGTGVLHTPPPILMYHYIRSADPADPAGYGLSVAPEQLAAQLDWLAREGYTTLRVDEALACLGGAPGCPTKPVALTFDDGYMDAYTAALPLLRERGMVATFYIVGGFVGQPGYMGTAELRALHAAGMQLGAHSMRHLDLTTLGREEALRELTTSKAVVEAVTGAPATSFCYPAGRYTPEVRALVAEAGFASAVTTDPPGDFGDPLLLPRVRVDGAADLEAFGWLLENQ